MRFRSPVIAALTLVLALGVSGCDAVSDALQPKTEVVTSEGLVAAPGAKVSGELPAGLPQDLPLWPAATVVSGEVDEDGTIDLALDATASFDDVVAGIGVGFEKAGWKVVESLTDNTTTVLEVSNDAYDGVITITNGEDVGTSVEYLLSAAK